MHSDSVRGHIRFTVISYLWSQLVFGCGTIPEDKSLGPKVNLLAVTEESRVDTSPREYQVTHRVEIVTSMGPIVIALYGENAPVTVDNFLKYVENGHYIGKIFHRVIPEFMVQGGGFDEEMQYGKTDLPIKLEIIPGLRHESGIVSMARTGDPDSATSQFFICVGDALQLNGDYAAFGKVEKGMDVVFAISNVATNTVETEQRSMANVPISPVLIKSITRI